MALTLGANFQIVSSWKLLISATVTVSSVISSDLEVYGVPIFPTTNTDGRASDIIFPRRAVVVVFPFVPVIARTSPFPV